MTTHRSSFHQRMTNNMFGTLFIAVGYNLSKSDDQMDSALGTAPMGVGAWRSLNCSTGTNRPDRAKEPLCG